MTITSSGQLKFSDLQTEFGGTNPISLSEYYAGNLVAPGTIGNSGAIPASGNPLNIGKFYGSAAAGVLWGSRFIKVGSLAQFSSAAGTVRYLNGKFFIVSSPDNWTALTYSTDSTATSWTTTSIANGTYFGPNNGPINTYTPVIYDIASNGSIYVVAGSSLGPAATSAPTGVLATSTDLVNWTFYSFLNGFAPKRIIYSPEKSLFVGIGTSKLFTSTDGITWTERALPSAPSWYSVFWNGFVFVATGYGYIAYSTDGINWTASSGLNVNYQYYDIAWGNNIFVVGSSNNGAVYTSPNGVTWTQRAVPLTSGYSGANASFGAGLFVFPCQGDLITSPDGITWTKSKLPVYSLAYGASKFIGSGGSTGSGGLKTSTDGINWTTLSSGTYADLQSVASDGNITVAVGNNTITPFSSTRSLPTIFSTTDGINWSYQNTNNLTTYNTPNFNSVVWNGTRFIALGNAYNGTGALIATSTNGSTWATQVDTLGTAGLGPSKMAAIGNTVVTNSMLNSYDGGLTWVQKTDTSSDVIESSPTQFFKCYRNIYTSNSGSYPNSQKYYVSSDGLTWTLRNFSNTVFATQDAINGNFGVGGSGQIFWISNVRWCNDRWIIAGRGIVKIPYSTSFAIIQRPRLIYSTDGINWADCLGFNYSTGYNYPTEFVDAYYAFGKYFAIGASDIWSSSDGVTFTELKSANDNTINEYSPKTLGGGFISMNKMTASSTKIIIVGKNGGIVTSPRPTTVSI
jgi:hypothetical protein